MTDFSDLSILMLRSRRGAPSPCKVAETKHHTTSGGVGTLVTVYFGGESLRHLPLILRALIVFLEIEDADRYRVTTIRIRSGFMQRFICHKDVID